MKLSNEDIDKIAEAVISKLIDRKYPESKIQSMMERKFSEDTRLTMISCIEDKINDLVFNEIYRLVDRLIESKMDDLRLSYNEKFTNEVDKSLNQLTYQDSTYSRHIGELREYINMLYYEVKHKDI